MVLFNTIDNIYRYNAQLDISCLRGSVGRTLIFLSSPLLVRIPYVRKPICDMCFVFMPF